MPRSLGIAFVLAGLLPPNLAAETPEFHWKSGQVLTYRVAQTTTAVESLNDADPMTTTTQLNLTKRWQVTDVSAEGVATLQMSLVALRMETRPPRGEPMIFDSAKPESATDGLREELARYVGPPIVIVQIDRLGRLVAVKECRFGPPSRLESDLPFKLILPGGAMTAGQSWERTFAIKLDPPHGAGESHDAIQKYTCKSVADGSAVIAMSTELKSPPESASDRLPLLPLLARGDVVFDVSRGRLREVRLQNQHELTNHRGQGSRYVLKTDSVETLIESK